MGEFGEVLEYAFGKVLEGTDVSAETVHESVFGGKASLSQTRPLFLKACGIIRFAARTSPNRKQLKAYLANNKVRGDLHETALAFWERKEKQAREILVSSSRFADSLLGFKWRVDFKGSSSADQGEVVNEPTAIVEMVVGKRGKKDERHEVMHFEMSKAQLGDVLAQLKVLENELEERSM